MMPQTILIRIVTRVVPRSLKVNSAKVLNAKQPILSQPPQNYAPNMVLPVRQYSTPPEGSLEKMIVDYEQVKKATDQKDILIVDVREPDEIKEHGKIPNSINIPLGSVSSVLGTMPDKEFEQTFNRPKPSEDSEIIFYCMIGKRSGMAQQNAFNLGYKNVKNYLGSWTDWASKRQ